MPQISLAVSTADSASDITQLLTSVNWSGDIAQCGRTLSFSVAASPVDKNIPEIDLPLGAGVSFWADGQALFEGHVFTRQKLTGSSTMEITCFDRGIYLKRNKATYKFANMAPEAATKRACDDFGIETGSIAQTGIGISRNFVGVPVYQVIQTMYTLASRQTGDMYHIRFDGAKLSVLVKGISPETLIIRGGSNLMSAAATESIERTVTRVAVYGDDDKPLRTVDSAGLISLYGVMQEYLKQAKDEDADAKAQKLLDDNGVSQKVTLDNMGDIRCIAGNAVAVQEPYTGLSGLYWIDSDTHAWKNGLYLNKLALNFRRMMDEQEAGALPEIKASGSPAAVSDKWEYLHKRG
jgi:hypothetical protein